MVGKPGALAGMAPLLVPPGAADVPAPRKEGMTTPHVLLVEDDEDYAHVVQRMFSKVGHKGPVRIVHDEASALAAIAQGPFDVVVSDLELHPGSGVRVLQRARERYPKALRILLTSAPDKARAHLGDGMELVHAIWDKHWPLTQIQDELRRTLRPSQ